MSHRGQVSADLLSERPLRVLFVNEGDLGEMLGSVTIENTLKAAFPSGSHSVESRFLTLPPMGWRARAATRGIPGLGRIDLDLQPLRWSLIQASRTRRVVEEAIAGEQFDVIHVNSHSIGIALVDIMRRIPVLLSADSSIWSWQEFDIWRQVRPYSRTLLRPSIARERRALLGAHAVLARSEWARVALLREAPGAKVLVYHPGVDLTRFAPADHQPSEPPRVLFVGARFKAKGGFDLLRAMAPLLATGAQLDIVTREEVPVTRGVNTHRLGHGDQRLVELYQKADLFCLPTYGDASPNSIIEAMACGTAVVASNVGGIAEQVGDGVGGVLVPPGDVAALRGTLESMVGDRERLRALGRSGRQRCEERYDLIQQAAKLVDIMRDSVAAEPL